ncbi:hypothetical protein DN752_19025 [Echinicola strongylocentroti]|uniref:Glycosyltransferase 2-like domain-containing protein n=1 Tax=Echinicola strongylocentroti TaxID=1795355 RepID=A0A2Z4IN48_9BACT|nr:glycosyltransferase family 2 protein [Echinicola strongylocentroti]AWW32058.1 hypothetical protein DN752_19025 [Echinicola strongylocentroti]
MNREAPLVSILIPNYNKAPYIRETLDSVLNQTYQHWECIIVDDHSTDESWEILEEYSAKDDRFKVFQRPDHLAKGGNVCRNYALRLSLGEYIQFLDSDDILALTCLNEECRFVKKYPQKDFLVFNSELFDKSPGDLGVLWNIDKEENDFYRYLKTDGVWQTAGALYKRSFFLLNLAFNEDLSIWQDFDLHFRAILVSKNYKKLLGLKPNIFIRNGLENSISRTKDRKVVLDQLKNRFIIYLSFKELIRKGGLDFDKPGYFIYKSVCFWFAAQFYVKYGRWDGFIESLNQLRKSQNLPFYKCELYKVHCLMLKVANRWRPMKKLLVFLGGIK